MGNKKPPKVLYTYADMDAWVSRAKDKEVGRIYSAYMLQKIGTDIHVSIWWYTRVGSIYKCRARFPLGVLTPDNVFTWTMSEEDTTRFKYTLSTVSWRIGLGFRRVRKGDYAVNGVLVFPGLKINMLTGMVLNREKAPVRIIDDTPRKDFVSKWSVYMKQVRGIVAVGALNDVLTWDPHQKHSAMTSISHETIYKYVVGGTNHLTVATYLMCRSIERQHGRLSHYGAKEIKAAIDTYYTTYRDEFLSLHGALRYESEGTESTG